MAPGAGSRSAGRDGRVDARMGDRASWSGIANALGGGESSRLRRGVSVVPWIGRAASRCPRRGSAPVSGGTTPPRWPRLARSVGPDAGMESALGQGSQARRAIAGVTAPAPRAGRSWFALGPGLGAAIDRGRRPADRLRARADRECDPGRMDRQSFRQGSVLDSAHRADRRGGGVEHARGVGTALGRSAGGGPRRDGGSTPVPGLGALRGMDRGGRRVDRRRLPRWGRSEEAR
jgi:hypothetical protein